MWMRVITFWVWRNLEEMRRVGYVQDVRYIAIEHMDVRRDPIGVTHGSK